jgi:hypothetical protein
MMISRRKVIDLGIVLMQAETTFKQPIVGKFYYACVKNREMAKEEYKLYMEANPYPPQFDEYETKRISIINEVGNSIKEGFSELPTQVRDSILNSNDPNVMPPEKRDLLIAKVNELRTEYKDMLAEIEQIDQRRNEFLDEEDDFAIKTVKLSEVPEIVGGNGYQIMNALDPMIVED